MNKQFKPEPVYAVMRADMFHKQIDIEHLVSVVAIFLDAGEVEKEVVRLNKLVDPRKVKYYWQITKVEQPNGR